MPIWKAVSTARVMATVCTAMPTIISRLMIGSLHGAGLAIHDVGITLFHAQGQRRGAVGDQVQHQQLDRYQGQRPTGQHGQ